MTETVTSAAERFERSATPLIIDGVFSQAMFSVVGGAFLAAFALALGASNFQIGLLAALPPAGQLMQVPAVLIIRRLGRRKPVAVVAAAASRLVWVLIALVPLVAMGSGAFSMVAGLVLLASAFGSVGGVAFMSLVRDLVPEEVMGRFFGRRMMLATVAAIAVSIAAGYFVDHWQVVRPDAPVLAYSIIFGAGVVFGIIGLVFLARVEEVPVAAVPGGGLRAVMRDLAEPFREPNFRRLMGFAVAWTFAITFAAPFYVIYMLERIGLPLSSVIMLSILSQVFTVLFLGFWGGVADRFSNRSALGGAGTILLLAILGWTFTTLPERYWLTVPLLIVIHAFMGLAMGGITLAIGNIGLKLSPPGRAEAYVTSLGLVNSGVAALSPIIAGALAAFFATKEVTLTLTMLDADRVLNVPTVSMRGLDFLFLITFLLGLYAMHRLAGVHEEGSVDERVVLEELREQIFEDVRALASFSTLRQVASFSGYAVPKRVRRRFVRVRAGEADGEP